MFMAIIRILVATFFLPSLSNLAKAASPEEYLAKYLMAKDVQITRAMRQSDLGLASYRENGPVVILEIATSARRVFYYAEINDLGGILLSASLDFSDIKTEVQAHKITCGDILLALKDEVLLRSACWLLR